MSPSVKLLLGLTAVLPAAAMSTVLSSSIPSPAPVGTPVEWNAWVEDTAAQNVQYRYRARRLNTEFRLIRDFGPSSILDWTAPDYDGTYEVEVTARDPDTGETATASVLFEMLSRVTGDTAVISATANPLVFLYSAPEHRAGARMRVYFRGPDGAEHFQAVGGQYQNCQPSAFEVLLISQALIGGQKQVKALFGPAQHPICCTVLASDGVNQSTRSSGRHSSTRILNVALRPAGTH